MPETKGRTLEGLDRVFDQGTWEFAKRALNEGKQSLRNTAKQTIPPYDGMPLGPLNQHKAVQNPVEPMNGDVPPHN